MHHRAHGLSPGLMVSEPATTSTPDLMDGFTSKALLCPTCELLCACKGLSVFLSKNSRLSAAYLLICRRCLNLLSFAVTPGLDSGSRRPDEMIPLAPANSISQARPLDLDGCERRCCDDGCERRCSQQGRLLLDARWRCNAAMHALLCFPSLINTTLSRLLRFKLTQIKTAVANLRPDIRRQQPLPSPHCDTPCTPPCIQHHRSSFT